MTKGFKELYNEVIKEGFLHKSLCTVCGACVAVCPEDLLEFREHIFYSVEDFKESQIHKRDLEEIFNKCIDCGLCYDACPEINFSLKEAEERLYGTAIDKYTAIGYIRQILSGQSIQSNFLINGQAGGVVTSLINYLLHENIVDGAIVTIGSSENKWKPIPVIVTKKNIKLLKQSQKSKYFSSGVLTRLRDTSKDETIKTLAIVLLPCQAHALEKMRQSKKYNKITKKVKITIGLFCLGAYWTHKFFDLLNKKYNVSPNQITNMRFLQDSFVIELEDGSVISGHRDIFMSAIKESCKHCNDFTNVLADISIGEIGSPKNWSTIIVRTNMGFSVLHDAEKKGYLKLSNISEEGVKKLYQIALLKFKYHVTRKALSLTNNVNLEKLIKSFDLPTATKQGLLALYIFTNTGLPFYSRNFSSKTLRTDQAIIAGITTAINEYVKTIFRDESIKEIDLQSVKILIEHSKKITLVAIVESNSDLVKNRRIFIEICEELEKMEIPEYVQKNLTTSGVEEKIDATIRSRFPSF